MYVLAADHISYIGNVWVIEWQLVQRMSLEDGWTEVYYYWNVIYRKPGKGSFIS